MSQYAKLDATFVLAQIEALKRSHPDLAEDADLLRDTIEGETDFNRVLEKVVAVALESRFIVDGLTNYMEVLKARQERFDRKGGAMRGIAQAMMKAANQTSILLPIASLNIRQGPSSVEIDDIASLPQGFTRTETTIIPLKKELKDALAVGSVPGAHLSVPEPSISIRAK